MVCATPRCGSALLCDTLWRTKHAGFPDEYFLPALLNRIDWKRDSPEEICEVIVRQGMSKNGIVGVKTMWIHFSEFAEKISALPGFNPLSVSGLRRLFPNFKFIWIYRDDAVKQAVSFEKAVQTSIWNSKQMNGRKKESELIYDFAEIKRRYDDLQAQNESWKRFFEEEGIEPFVVKYEDLMRSYDVITRSVLDFLRVELSADYEIKAPSLCKQSTSLNDEWVQRFRAESRLR
jgi:LPS sulfotransferase NodH